MSEQQPEGDLQIEIGDTRGPIEGAGPGVAAPSPLHPQLTPRRLALRLALALALLLIVGVFLRSASAHLTSGSAAPTALPLASIVLLSNVSYGTVTLNGRRLAGPPPLVMTFRAGVNDAALTAPPFGTETCQIDWPSGNVREGPCDTDRSGRTYTIYGRTVVSALDVTLTLTGANMKPEMYAAAMATIGAAVSAVHLDTTVPAGTYIATGREASGQIMFTRTTTPLAADLSFMLDTSGPPTPGCPPFCYARLTPDVASRLVGQVVAADVSVAAQWSFASGGTAVARSAMYPASAVTIALVYDSVVGWQVSPTATQAINGVTLSAGLALTMCAAGADALSALALRAGVGLVQSHDHGIEGCELDLLAGNGTLQATIIWRFGVLLAADAGAQQLAPSLPVAPPAEITAISG
jgi:hypothetical protein